MTKINKIFGIDVDSRRAVNGSKRGDGFAVEKVHHQDINQLLFELGADHIIGSQSQVTGITATIYYDSATTSFKDKNGSAPTILDGDKIAWRGLDAITANIDLSAYDDIEHIMFQGVTIALGNFDLLLGENQRGELDLTSTGGELNVLSSDGLRVKTSGSLSVTNASGDIVVNNEIRSEKVQWEAEGLQIDYISNTQSQATFKRLSLLDDNYKPKFLNNKTLTWDITSHLEPGTTEKGSTWYDKWVDSDENLILAPRLTGTCDGTSTGFLVDSTATLLTDLVHAGDIAQNIATGEITTVSIDASAEGQVAVTDDIFASGNAYQIIKLSPVGLGANKERIGMVFNNGSGNFSDSGYIRPELQKKHEYSEFYGDFAASGTSWTTSFSAITPYQIFDIYQTPIWLNDIKLVGSYGGAAVASYTITLTGIIFYATQPAQINDNGTVGISGSRADGATSALSYFKGSSTMTQIYAAAFEVRSTTKPTFATRS